MDVESGRVIMKGQEEREGGGDVQGVGGGGGEEGERRLW